MITQEDSEAFILSFLEGISPEFGNSLPSPQPNSDILMLSNAFPHFDPVGFVKDRLLEHEKSLVSACQLLHTTYDPVHVLVQIRIGLESAADAVWVMTPKNPALFLRRAIQLELRELKNEDSYFSETNFYDLDALISVWRKECKLDDAARSLEWFGKLDGDSKRTTLTQRLAHLDEQAHEGRSDYTSAWRFCSASVHGKAWVKKLNGVGGAPDQTSCTSLFALSVLALAESYRLYSERSGNNVSVRIGGLSEVQTP